MKFTYLLLHFLHINQYKMHFIIINILLIPIEEHNKIEKKENLSKIYYLINIRL